MSDEIRKSATTEKWSEIISEVDTKRTFHLIEKMHKIESMTVNVVRKIYMQHTLF